MGLFATHGLKFTMQQVATDIHVSKKTIYAEYESKEALLADMVDAAFAAIHERKRELIDAPGTTLERLRNHIAALPEELVALDLRHMDELQDQYPAVAARVRRHIETGWEPTLALLAQAMDEGVLRRVSPAVFRVMVSSTIEAFLVQETLADSGVSYAEALGQMVSILFEGLEVK